VIEGGGEDDVRDFEFALDKFLEDAEAVEAGHLDVKEDEIGIVFLDEVNGVEAIFALSEEIDFREGFKEEGEFVAGGLFVVDDDGVDGHEKNTLSIASEEESGERPFEAQGKPFQAQGRRVARRTEWNGRTVEEWNSKDEPKTHVQEANVGHPRTQDPP